MADVERWITIHPNGADSKGQPIPVKEGQSNKQATESFLAKKKNKATTPEEKAKEKFVLTMNTPVDNIVDVQSQYGIVNNKVIRQQLESLGVKRKIVNRLPSKLNTKEIIDRVSGGDKTKGSCSSVALAYIGNKAGFDVLDFRGGDSLYVFSQNGNLKEIANLKGVMSFISNEYNDYNAALKLTHNIREGKEYLFVIGKHSAIVKKESNHLYYLELQDPKKNGFQRLNNSVLKNRFGCQKSYSIGRTKIKNRAILIDCESLGKNKDFQTMLAYINTNENKQKKGVDGRVK